MDQHPLIKLICVVWKVTRTKRAMMKRSKILFLIVGIGLVYEQIVEEYKTILRTISKFLTFLESIRSTLERAFGMVASLLESHFAGYLVTIRLGYEMILTKTKNTTRTSL